MASTLREKLHKIIDEMPEDRLEHTKALLIALCEDGAEDGMPPCSGTVAELNAKIERSLSYTPNPKEPSAEDSQRN